MLTVIDKKKKKKKNGVWDLVHTNTPHTRMVHKSLSNRPRIDTWLYLWIGQCHTIGLPVGRVGDGLCFAILKELTGVAACYLLYTQI